MSPKLATVMVCIGIAAGSLSAPKSPKSNAKEPSPTADRTLVGEEIRDESIGRIQDPPSPNNIAPTPPVRAEVSFIAPSLTNAFGVAIQQ